ncbi:MAG: GMC oxidoreductase [Verrucomicrobiota bacterium]
MMNHTYKTFFEGDAPKPAGISLGYPVPGPQSASADQIANAAFFASACDWNTVLTETFDFIVVGTGPTGVAFIEESFRLNPKARILVLDRGGFWLPVHYQMLATSFQATGGSPPTTYPWTRTTQMVTTGEKFFQAGYMPIVGGRSSYWSAWCPMPNPDQMRDWPDEVIAVTQQPGFWERAKKFLHVTSMDQIQDGVYGNLQTQLDSNIQQNFRRLVPTAQHAYAAPIAVDIPEWKSVKFFKYSTVGTLFDLYEAQKALAAAGKGTALTMADHCVVDRMIHDGQGSVIALETSRGPLPVGNAKVILSMGAIPPATLLMNSFGDRLPNAGQRYTGHFMSHVTARVRRSAFKDLSSLEIAALYLDGKAANGLQYHVQTSAFSATDPVADAGTIAREAPDAAAVATPAQLGESVEYVVFVCATLGEVSEKNPDNWLRRNGGGDPTTNISLQLTLNSDDYDLWEVLDAATYQNIEAMTAPAGAAAPVVEYWVEQPDGTGKWETTKPPREQIRLNIIVHEASPLWMGTDARTSVVGLDYRPHGVANVYVTGASLFPTCGSWNPTLTMCGLAQDLASRLA